MDEDPDNTGEPRKTNGKLNDRAEEICRSGQVAHTAPLSLSPSTRQDVSDFNPPLSVHPRPGLPVGSGTKEIPDLLDTLRENLLGEFKADTVIMRVAGMSEVQTRECGVDAYDPDASELQHFETFLKGSRPQCGRFKTEQLQYLFGDQAQAIESVALIPLGHHCQHGLLAIGSREASRFHPGMGTLFLTHLGELMDMLLGEHLDNPAQPD